MKKTGYAIIFTLLIAGLPASGVDYTALGNLAKKIPKPEASLEKFEIKKISLRDITFTFDVSVKNPYPVSLKLESVELDFTVEKNKLFHTATAGEFSVAARGKKTSSFDVTLTYSDIIKVIRDYTAKDYLECEIDMVVNIPIPKIVQGPPRITFPFKVSRKIPAIKPSVTVQNFSVTPPTLDEVQDALKDSGKETVKNLDAAKVQSMFTALFKGGSVKEVVPPAELDMKFKVGFDIILKNEAKAPLDFRKVNFDFNVNSDNLVSGKTGDITMNGTTTVIKMVNEFSSKNITKSVLNAFKTGKGEFTVNGKTSLQLPSAISPSPLDLEFSEKGSFNLR